MTTIHGLPAATSALPADEVPVFQGGTTTRKATVAQIIGTAPPIGAAGRLTLTSLNPVMPASVTGGTTVYYSPYKGRQIPIYNGTSFVRTDFGGELSQLTTDATKSPAAVAPSSVYDMFVWNDAGTIRCTRGPAWTTAAAPGAARSMALNLLAGFYVNSAAITNGPGQYLGTYVGSIASNASSTIDFIYGTAVATGGIASLMVWNYYNRSRIATRVTDTGGSYPYTLSAARQARGPGVNQIGYLCGVPEDTPLANYQQVCTLNAVAGTFVNVGVGDNAVAFDTPPSTLITDAAVAVTISGIVTYMKPTGDPILGTNILYAVEASDGSQANTFNVGGQGELSFNFFM